jgi:hypothetical protein
MAKNVTFVEALQVSVLVGREARGTQGILTGVIPGSSSPLHEHRDERLVTAKNVTPWGFVEPARARSGS